MKYVIETKTDEGFHYEYIYYDLGSVFVGDTISMIIQTKDLLTRTDYKVLSKRICYHDLNQEHRRSEFVDINLFCEKVILEIENER